MTGLGFMGGGKVRVAPKHGVGVVHFADHDRSHALLRHQRRSSKVL